jgi:hypothetical protein
MGKKSDKNDTEKKDSKDNQDSKIKRMTADLEASRKQKDEHVMQLNNRIAWLTGELEMQQRQNAKLKSASDNKDSKIAELKNDLETLQKKFVQVRKEKGAKAELPDWLFTWEKVMETDVPIAGHRIMVSRLLGSLEFPNGYEHAGQIDPEQLDDKSLNMADLKDFIKTEFGSGQYRIRSFNVDNGFDKLVGVTQFSVK